VFSNVTVPSLAPSRRARSASSYGATSSVTSATASPAVSRAASAAPAPATKLPLATSTRPLLSIVTSPVPPNTSRPALTCW
jgi:hypothetical protein